MQLSKYLSRKEYEFSPTAVRNNISNAMNEDQIESAKQLAVNIFDPIRERRGYPSKISSGFRSSELNKKIGGSKDSQHSRAEALDIESNSKEFHWIKDNLVYDQLIFEFPENGEPDWLHISYTTKKKNRMEVLISVKRMVGGKLKTVYLPYKGNESLIN